MIHLKLSGILVFFLCAVRLSGRAETEVSSFFSLSVPIEKDNSYRKFKRTLIMEMHHNIYIRNGQCLPNPPPTTHVCMFACLFNIFSQPLGLGFFSLQNILGEGGSFPA